MTECQVCQLGQKCVAKTIPLWKSPDVLCLITPKTQPYVCELILHIIFYGFCCEHVETELCYVVVV